VQTQRPFIKHALTRKPHCLLYIKILRPSYGSSINAVHLPLAPASACQVDVSNALAQRGLFFPQIVVNSTPSDQHNSFQHGDVKSGGIATVVLHAAHGAAQYQLRA